MLPAIRDAARGLARDRGFTLLASALLALTIGTTIAIYAVVDAIVLRPFALARQDRLVVIWEGYSGRDSPVVEVALGEVDDWRQHSKSFESLAVFGSVNLQLTIGDGSARARVPYAVVSSPFFSVAGTPPLLGRVFEAGDELGTRARTVVLSHDLWMRRYGADPLAVGRRLEVQLEPDEPMRSLEIIGVMPAGFDFPRGAGLWLPAAPGLREIGERFGNPDQMVANFKIFYALGRLRDGVSAMTAQHELTSVIHQLQPARASAAAPDATVLPIDRYLLGPTRPVLWTLLAAAVLMLAIACANIAGLHVFRAARQDRALATRLALGASHAQLVQQSLCESVLLAVAGAVGAGLVAWLTSHVLILAAPVDVPRLSSITLVAPGVFAMNVGLVGAATILSGLWPAMFAGRLDAGSVLAHGARAAANRRERRLQRMLVVSQVAVAVVLLAGTGLFVRSVRQLDRTALGFDPENLLAIDVEPDTAGEERWDAFYGALLARIEALPSVVSAAAIYLRPLSGPIGNDVRPVLRGQPDERTWARNPLANLESVTDDYFRVMKARLLRGRSFDPADASRSAQVLIVSESAAARYWPGQDPIGQVLVVPAQREPGTREQPRWQTVIGVVEDIRYRGQTDPRLDVYLPARQSTLRVKHVLVRTTGDPMQLAAAVRAAARELDANVHVGGATTMREVVSREGAPWRFAMRVLAAFGGLAAVLAAVGLGASLSLMVSLRRRELGIRSALGASPRRLRRDILGEGMRLAACGSALGFLGALGFGRAVGGVLVSVRPDDPYSTVGAALIAIAAAGVGCVLPANRASTTDPAEALRSE
jgi:predicted permease